jgi:hypothetical protein
MVDNIDVGIRPFSDRPNVGDEICVAFENGDEGTVARAKVTQTGLDFYRDDIDPSKIVGWFPFPTEEDFE